MNYNETVYTALMDCKGYPYIEVNILSNRIREFAKETTSPRGVMTILYVEGKELRSWKSKYVETFETEEEAWNEWLAQTYVQDYLPNCSNDYSTMDEAVSAIAEYMELSEAVVRSLLKHHELYRAIESKKTARRIMARYYKAKKNSNGNMTKNLIKATNEAKWPCRYMYGTNPYWGPRLDVENYYTEEFKEEIRKK